MRNKSSLIRLFRGLLDLIDDEAERSAEFAAKLDDLLPPIPSKTRSKVTRSKVKSEPDVPDIYAERKMRGEDEFRLWLRDQSVPVLRAIIRKHDLDSARRTARWKDTEKLAAYIADGLRGRVERGSSFMRGG
jgi:hypothetical protein